MELIPLVNLIEAKRGTEKEVLLILFERCNLSCSFCHQDHSSWAGLESIMDKAQAILQDYNGVDHYTINITGGEIFMDEVPDEIFEHYYQFARAISGGIKSHRINFISNLVFDNHPRVLDLFERLTATDTNFSLGTSYDPRGRFNRFTRAVFERNLRVFSHYLTDVSMVLTQQSVQHFLSGVEDTTFEYLYAHYPIFVDHYTPGPDYQRHQPSDAEIVDLYIYLSEHYPDVEPVKSFRERVNNPTTCRSTTVVMPNSRSVSCRALITEDPIWDGKQAADIKHQAEADFVEQFGCLECEHFTRCGLRCFLHNEFLPTRSRECQFKRMFDTILT